MDVKSDLKTLLQVEDCLHVGCKLVVHLGAKYDQLPVNTCFNKVSLCYLLVYRHTAKDNDG